MTATPRRARRLPLAVGAVGAIAALTLLAGCASDSGHAAPAADAANTTVTIRIPDPGNSGTLAVGKKDGSLAAALGAVGAKVVWTGSAGPFAPAAQELNAGELDIAQGSITSAVAALAQSPSFELFAANAPDRQFEGILVRKDSPIRTVADLAGRKVAVNKGGTEEYLLLKALRQAGVDPSRVQRVYLQPPQTAPVFNSGQIDAWSTWATYSIPELAQFNAHFLVTGGQIGSDNYAVWAVRTAFAQAHPKVVKALYDYLHAGDAKQAASPEAYINVFTKSGPTAVPPAQRALTAQQYQESLTTNAITAADTARFGAVAQFFATEKVTPSAVDVRPHVLDVTGLG